MEVKKENIVNAYKKGDDSVKKMLRTMFPDIEFETAQPQTRAEERRNVPVTERIKTFKDAVEELGEKHPFVRQWAAFVGSSFDNGVDRDNADLYAYYKLRIITAALNEGWRPKLEREEQRRYPYFSLYATAYEFEKASPGLKKCHGLATTDGYVAEYAGFITEFQTYNTDGTRVDFGARLCYKNRVLADYSGKQFIDLWADFYLIRKK